MTGSGPDVAAILERQVFIRGENRPFGTLTIEDARGRAQELREATGWGPTARIAPVALAWRQLADEMARAGTATVADLGADELVKLAPRLWVVMPGGSLMK